MLCPHCHKENRSGALLCEFCGRQLVTLSDLSRYKTGKFDTIPLRWRPIEPTITLDRPGSGFLHQANFITLQLLDEDENIKVKTQGHISLGRADADSSWQPTIDLSPYGAVEKGVSRLHADLFFENDQVFVLELGSANGTRINGVAVQMGLAQQIRNGDELELGRMRLRVSFS